MALASPAAQDLGPARLAYDSDLKDLPIFLYMFDFRMHFDFSYFCDLRNCPAAVHLQQGNLNPKLGALPGKDHVDQLRKIVELLGSPTEAADIRLCVHGGA